MREKRESQKPQIDALITNTFKGGEVPEEFVECRNIEDFEKVFGKDFLRGFWQYMYDLEFSKIRYVLPFAMLYYIRQERPDIDDKADLELLVRELTPVDDLRNENFAKYNKFSQAERNAIYTWLLFLKNHFPMSWAVDIEHAIVFWKNFVIQISA